MNPVPPPAAPAHLSFLNPARLAPPPGYSHVVTARGRTVYVSGQVALDGAGQIVGQDDFGAQADQVFRNLGCALEAAGAHFGHVVKLTTFVTSLDSVAVFRQVRDRYVATAHPPASSLVQVSRLFRDEFLLEVEAVAVLPD